MGLDRIVGHRTAALSIRAALRGDRPAHAYLFAGPDGVGKFLFALQVAKMLLCRGDQGDDACDVCRSCRQADSDSHPDLHRVQAADGKRFISIEQIQVLRRRFALRPHGERLVAIVRDADRMTPPAANALLKTLEEPPAWATLLLTASRPSALPETILSRCQTLRFGPLSCEEVERILEAEFDWPPEATRFAASFSDGSVGQAAEIHGLGGLELRNALMDRLGRLTTQDNFDLSEFALERAAEVGGVLEDKRAALRRMLQIILRYYRDALGHKLGVPPDKSFNADRLDDIRAAANALSEDAIEAAIELTLRACEDLNRNAKLDLLLDQYFFDLATVAASPPPVAPARGRAAR